MTAFNYDNIEIFKYGGLEIVLLKTKKIVNHRSEYLKIQVCELHMDSISIYLFTFIVVFYNTYPMLDCMLCWLQKHLETK